MINSPVKSVLLLPIQKRSDNTEHTFGNKKELTTDFDKLSYDRIKVYQM